jgi:hypothetical protein
MHKKFITTILILALMSNLAIVPVVSADTISNSGTSEYQLSEEEKQQIREMEEAAMQNIRMEKLSKQEDKAITLYYLGLFKGTDTSFDLDRAPTRTEAVVLLLRMLGKEQEAKDSSYIHPFNDVPAWADKYIAYAYNKGLANGYTATTFGASDNAVPEQFLTFALRALEYSDKDGDFTYKEAIKKAEEVGLAEIGEYTAGSKEFTRGDCVDIIYRALTATKKIEQVTLAEYLVKTNAIDELKAVDYGLYAPKEN